MNSDPETTNQRRKQVQLVIQVVLAVGFCVYLVLDGRFPWLACIGGFGTLSAILLIDSQTQVRTYSHSTLEQVGMGAVLFVLGSGLVYYLVVLDRQPDVTVVQAVGFTVGLFAAHLLATIGFPAVQSKF